MLLLSLLRPCSCANQSLGASPLATLWLQDTKCDVYKDLFEGEASWGNNFDTFWCPRNF